MKTDFQFSNLLGTVYCKGNLLFTSDGACLISPVGNRLTVFDLINNKSHTLPFAHRRNINRIALSPQGNLLLSVDQDGRAILSNFPRRLALHYFSFRGPPSALSFSPSGRYFAVGLGRFVEVWHTPTTPDSTEEGQLEYAPFVRHRVYAGHYDTAQSLEWSSDSRFFLSTSKDLTARIWSLDPEESFVPTTLAGHREGVIGGWFSKDQESIYTVSQDGALFEWAYISKEATIDGDPMKRVDEDLLRWRILRRHYFLNDHAKVSCAAYHATLNLLVVGFSNGLFSLYELPEFNMMHTLSISQKEIDFVTINASGEWLAFGASKLGQLLVWEWQSESYILKQQNHYGSANALVYSPDGQQIITAADDGKIKVWDVRSGFCIVTFTEHSAAVTACEFSKRGKVLFTASLDGSLRAWDLIRFRNFRTFTAPTRLTFSSIAVDPSGEVICAGSLDSFDIYLWSIQTGQLLDQLAGHGGPIAALAFAPNGGTVVSGSWDHTIRIWNIFGRTQTSEPLQLQADVLDLAIRPDSRQIAVSTLDGQLNFWSLAEASQEAGVDGRRDASGGRKVSDRRTAANAAGSKAFNAISYSVDGSCILAGGKTKYICLYDVQSGTLLKKFTVSINLTLDGTQEFLNSRNLTEAGPRGLFDTQGEASDLEDRIDRTLPGASRGDLSVRHSRPEVRVSALAFSPTARAFCVASTEGLLIYSLDHTLIFDPLDLDISITPASILEMLKEREYLRALVMAFRLNEHHLIRAVYEQIPNSDISLVIKNLPSVYLARLLRFVAQATDETPHLEFNLLWVEALMSQHGHYLRDNIAFFVADLRTLQKGVSKIQADLARMADANSYTLDYLISQPTSEIKLKPPAEDAIVENGKGYVNFDAIVAEGEWIGLDDKDGFT